MSSLAELLHLGLADKGPTSKFGVSYQNFKCYDI